VLNLGEISSQIKGRKEIADFYPTSPYVTEALMRREKFEGLIWECASGAGDMSRVLERHNTVFSSDIRKDHGVYGRKGVNFLISNRERVPNIVTNPPFMLAVDFVIHAKRRTEKKIAMFLPLAFLEGRERFVQRVFTHSVFPLKSVYVFCKRPNFGRQGIGGGQGMFGFAWFVWERGWKEAPVVSWIPPDEGMQVAKKRRKRR